ncbi:MAG: hypothetical protein AAGF26_12175 [Cyanobacteria bacterium P01_G01_bin.49]
MARFLKFPFLYLSIVLITYGTFGWYVGSSASRWTHLLVAQGETWGWFFENETIFLLLHILAGCLVLLITASLMAPVALVTVLSGNAFKSDSRAMISVLLWSFAVVLMIRWIVYFSQFFLLICAAILGKLELQKQDYLQWQVIVYLTITCLGGFGLGLISYYGLKG